MPERADRARLLASVLRSIGGVLQRLPRRWAWVPILGWSGLIWWLSSFPPPVVGVHHPASSWVTNFGHALEFGMLALLLTLAVPRRGGWPDLGSRTSAVLLAIALVYAISDEIHQSFTPHRDPSIFDVLTDVVGAALTLRVIASAAGPYAAPERLRGLLVRGILACVACAGLATFVPELFPELGWL